MVRALTAAYYGDDGAAHGVHRGFFAAVDGAPAAGYRARRADAGPAAGGPATILTGTYGAQVLAPLVEGTGHRIRAVANGFFGGNIAVAGLLTGADVAAALAGEPAGGRYLLPDVCLSEGRFLDGMTVADLPHPVEIVATDGRSLRLALAAPTRIPVAVRS